MNIDFFPEQQILEVDGALQHLPVGVEGVAPVLVAVVAVAVQDGHAGVVTVKQKVAISLKVIKKTFKWLNENTLGQRKTENIN